MHSQDSVTALYFRRSSFEIRTGTPLRLGAGFLGYLLQKQEGIELATDDGRFGNSPG